MVKIQKKGPFFDFFQKKNYRIKKVRKSEVDDNSEAWFQLMPQQKYINLSLPELDAKSPFFLKIFRKNFFVIQLPLFQKAIFGPKKIGFFDFCDFLGKKKN